MIERMAEHVREGQLELKRIDLWSLFKVSFFLYFVLGLVAGLFYGFFMLLATGLEYAIIEDEIPGFGLFGGVLGLVLIPVIAILYGVVGSVFVTVGGILYNIVAGLAGGIRIETRMGVSEPLGTMESQPVTETVEPEENPPPM